MRSIRRRSAIGVRHLRRNSLIPMEQGISQSKTGNTWQIYSDFKCDAENSLERQPQAVQEIFVSLECGVIPYIRRWLVGQGLDDSIDLVVVAPVGKSEKFVREVPEPGCLSRKKHLTVCEFFQLDGHAYQLVAIWNDSDRREGGGFEILYQRSSEPGFFNQNGVRSVLSRLRNRRPADMLHPEHD
jgi:hypothetical protein